MVATAGSQFEKKGGRERETQQAHKGLPPISTNVASSSSSYLHLLLVLKHSDPLGGKVFLRLVGACNGGGGRKDDDDALLYCTTLEQFLFGLGGGGGRFADLLFFFSKTGGGRMGAFWRRRYLLGTLVCDLKLHASSAAYPTGLFVVEKTPILYYPVSCVII